MTKKYNRYPRYGEAVRVYVDPLEPSARSIVKYNGLITTVSGTAKGPIYTLDGCEVNGIPYWFVREWLTLVNE